MHECKQTTEIPRCKRLSCLVQILLVCQFQRVGQRSRLIAEAVELVRVESRDCV